MKKSLLALAVMGAFAASAHAQSSVTVYGSFDAGIRHVDNVDATTGIDSKTTMGSAGTYSNNRLGFKGVEDLGGGMNAHFVLESGFNTGTGAMDAAGLFQRSAFVGLGGSWGSVDLGRQYSVNFQTIGAYEPFAYKYTGIIPLAAHGGLTRLDNDIKYTGTFGPVTVRAEYALGEQTGDTSALSTQAVGATYAAGPFSVGGAFTQGERTANAASRDFDNWTVGGAYVVGPFRVAAGYAQFTQDQSATTETELTNAWVGGSYKLSPAAELTLAYYTTKTDNPLNNTAPEATGDGRKNLLMIGGTYALSKRTNFYANIDMSKLKDANRMVDNVTGAIEDRVTGFSVGIHHLF